MFTLQLLNNTGSAVESLITDAIIQSWSKRVNGPGRMTYLLPVGSPNATAVKWQKFKRVKLLRRKQDGSGTDEVVWYGYIEAHKRTSPAEYTVFCAGMLQFFDSRQTTKDQAFTGAGSTEAFGLLSATNSDSDTGIVAGTGGVAATKDVKMTGYKDILGAWGDLAKAHNAEFEIDDLGRFNFVPQMGTDKTATVELIYRTDGQPGNNVEGLEEGEDGAPLRNRIIGTNSAGTLSSTKDDATSQASYPVRVEVKVFNEAQDQTTLDQMTQAHLDQVKHPVPDFGAKPKPPRLETNLVTFAREVVGLQYGSVVPGDLVTCDIVNGTETIQAQKRVIEILVDVDANLKENLQYTLGESGVFVSVQSLASTSPANLERRVLTLEQGSASGGGGGGGGGGSLSDFVDKEVPSGTIDGSNATFTLAQTPTGGSEHVCLNGMLMDAGSVDYSISGATITFTTPPSSGDILLVSYRIPLAGHTFVDEETPSGTIDGANATFTLAHTPTAGSEHVYLNGSLQDAGGVDYTIAGASIAFGSAPPPGSILLVSYRY